MDVSEQLLLNGGAKWITAPDFDVNARPPLPLFRRGFELDGRAIKRATLAICGLGHFELRVNGAKVGDDVLEPGWTDYRKTCLYVVHDVTSLLRSGAQNAIGVMLGNGMYNVSGGRYVKFRGSFGPPKLVTALHLEFADGSSASIQSDAAWRTAPGPVRFSCIYGGEDYDAREERFGWDSPGFEDHGWQAASEVAGPGGQLVRQDSPPSRVMQTFEAKTASDKGVYDLGQNFSGWPRVTVRGPAGSSVKLTTAELLDEHGNVNQRNSGRGVWFTYTLRGDAERDEVWEPRFSLTGFRYVQVAAVPPLAPGEGRGEGASAVGAASHASTPSPQPSPEGRGGQNADSPRVVKVEGRFVHAAARVVGEFSCSNDLFNRIHALIDNAVRSNMQSVLTDCPHREKLGWLEQVHLMGPAILARYDLSSYLAKVCRDMRDAQHEDGVVPTIAPQYTSFKPPWDIFNDSPEWGSSAVLVPWMVYTRYGDKRILEDNYEMMRRFTAYLQRRADASGGLVDYGLGDWYDIGPGAHGFSKLTSKALTGTCIFYQDLLAMRGASEVLGRAEDVKQYDRQLARVRETYLAKLFDAGTHRSDTGSQTACAMPLALGLIPADHRDAVLDQLISDIRSRDNHITAGDIGFKYVIEALANAGRSDVMFDILSRTDPPSYGAQLAAGATTLTEAWDASPRNSQNHLMLGHGQMWFYEYLAGIRVDMSKKPPEQIVIQPAVVGDVTWAKGSYESVVGRIESSWRREGSVVRLSINVPPGAGDATVLLPDGAKRTVQSGSHTVECAVRAAS